jgi:hypothetical protein
MTIRYSGEKKTAFESFHKLFADVELLRRFLLKWNANFDKYNRSTLVTPHDAAIQSVAAYAEYLSKLIEYASSHDAESLDRLFERLNKDQDPTSPVAPFKGKPNRWLRLFAIRIEGSRYIITGGTLKMSDKYRNFILTKMELDRQDLVIKWLTDSGIIDRESFERRILEV